MSFRLSSVINVFFKNVFENLTDFVCVIFPYAIQCKFYFIQYANVSLMSLLPIGPLRCYGTPLAPPARFGASSVPRPERPSMSASCLALKPRLAPALCPWSDHFPSPGSCSTHCSRCQLRASVSCPSASRSSLARPATTFSSSWPAAVRRALTRCWGGYWSRLPPVDTRRTPGTTGLTRMGDQTAAMWG